jgi:hypothetical protein
MFLAIAPDSICRRVIIVHGPSCLIFLYGDSCDPSLFTHLHKDPSFILKISNYAIQEILDLDTPPFGLAEPRVLSRDIYNNLRHSQILP